MEKKEKLKEFAGMCVKSLSDDAELHQEVEMELLDHLQDAFDDERRNVSDDAAFAKAVKRFGNPEEISRQLSEGNAARLSRHARIRRAIRWLLIPVLCVGTLLCIDVRGILASALVLKFAFPQVFGAKTFTVFNSGVRTKVLQAEEQLLFDYYYESDKNLELAEKLYSSKSDNAMNCAIYAMELAVSDTASRETQEKLKAVLENGRRLDVSNPLYDYIEAYVLMRNAGDLSAVDGENAIKDSPAFAKSVEIYSRALQGGVVRTYNDELHEKVQDMLVTRRDMLGGMQLLDLEHHERLPYLTVLNGIAKMLPLYCEMLYADGNDRQAIALLATWRVFLSQWLNGNHRHELDLMACVKQAKRFKASAMKIGATEEIAALQAVLDFQKEWLESISNHAQNGSYLQRLECGGILTTFAALGTEAKESEWRVERKLEAATFDVAALSIACVVILLIAVNYGVKAIVAHTRGRHPFLFIMPADSYKRLFMYGILIPAVAYLMLSWLTGGENGFWSWMLWQLLSIAFLCFCWPLFYWLLCHKAIAKRLRSIGAEGMDGFKASCPLNMLCLFAALLVAVGGIIRPVQNWRQRHYARQESIMIPWKGTENLQEQSLRKRHLSLANLL